MADNVTAPGRGTVFRTVEIAGKQYPVSILALPDGTLVAALPVSAASLPLPAGAATEASVAALLAKLPSLGAKTSSGSVSTTPASDATYKIAPATNTAGFASSAASTNATAAKGSAGTLRQVSGYNASSSPRYLRFYDTATTPTPGSTTIRKRVYLPPLSGFVFDYNDAFAVGIGFAITAAGADSDTTVIAAGDVTMFNVDYL